MQTFFTHQENNTNNSLLSRLLEQHMVTKHQLNLGLMHFDNVHHAATSALN